MSVLSLRLVWGASPDDEGRGVHFGDESTLIYTVGHTIVLYNMQDKTQRFIAGSTEDEGVSALALSPSNKFLAVGARADRASILIFDLKTLRKRKVLSQTAVACAKYAGVCFSNDNEMLLGMTGSTVMVWRWAKGKTVAQLELDAPGLSLSFSPVDAVVAVRQAQGVVFARLDGDELKPLPLSSVQLEDEAVSCQCWLKHADDYCVAGTTRGRLLVYRACHYRCDVQRLDNDCGVTSVAPAGDGFVAGSSKGTIHVYAAADSSFAATRSLSVPGPSCATKPAEPTQQQQPDEDRAIRSIAVRPDNDDAIVAMTSDQRLVTASLSCAQKSDSSEVTSLPCAAHGPGAVTGLDVCVRKPLAAAVALDRSLRVWNYANRELELCKYFAEDPFSVSLHPTGLHAIIGFSDKLRLVNLLVDEARVSREVPIKACRECRFSTGGQYFAAVNGNVIAIYEFYTCEKLVDLRGHNSKVKAVSWSRDDANIASCGQDGAVYQWDWGDGGKRSGEFVQKGTVYHSVVLGTNDTLLAVGSDKMLKELEAPELQPVKQLDANGTSLGQIALMKAEHMLFATTIDDAPGRVRAYSFPLTGDYVEYACASSALTRLRVSCDDKHVVVADEDGCIYVFDIKHEAPKTRSFSEEILVTKSDLEEKQVAALELKNKIEELELHNEYQLRLKDMSYGEKIKEVTEKYSLELEQEKTKYELLKEEKKDTAIECEERYRQLEDAHHHSLQEKENAYQQEIMAHVDKYQELETARSLAKHRYEQQRKELITAHDAYISELTDDFELKLDESHQARLALEDERAELDKEFIETKAQIEDDIDTEIENVRARYDAQLAAEREATLRFKGENGIMKKKFAVLTKDIEDAKEEMKGLLGREKELQESIKKLEKELLAHKSEIKKRDETIGTKEKKIYELKKKNQELEKFKFVLDFKIKDLKRQIEPRETEISKMKTQIKTMDAELEQYHQANAQLDTMIGGLRGKLDSTQKTILDKRKCIADKRASITRFKSQVHDCVQFIQDPDKLQEALTALQDAHRHKVCENHQLDPDVLAERDRHENALKLALHALQKQCAKDMADHSAANMRIMANNMGLIREIAKQRETNRLLKLAVQGQEAKLANDIAKRQYNKEGAKQHAELTARINELQAHVDSLDAALQDRGIDTTTIDHVPPPDSPPIPAPAARVAFST